MNGHVGTAGSALSAKLAYIISNKKKAEAGAPCVLYTINANAFFFLFLTARPRTAVNVHCKAIVKGNNHA